MTAGLPTTGPIWLVGCGNMGGAMLQRWIGAGIDAERITVIDPGTPTVPPGVNLVDQCPSDATADILVLAVKPQQLDALRDTGIGLMRPRLLISILAGVEELTLAEQWKAGAIVRAMPNLPVVIGKGVVALHSSTASGPDRDDAEALMAPLGLVEWIADEALFDAVTALSGCGPGFAFRFIAALADAGAALGLPADQAARLAIATVEGTGLMAAASSESMATLADRVASPGGSTREGLNVLDRDKALKKLLGETLAAAARRNAELADAARTGGQASGRP